jgi:hypothetical protein
MCESFSLVFRGHLCKVHVLPNPYFRKPAISKGYGSKNLKFGKFENLDSRFLTYPRCHRLCDEAIQEPPSCNASLLANDDVEHIARHHSTIFCFPEQLSSGEPGSGVATRFPPMIFSVAIEHFLSRGRMTMVES